MPKLSLSETIARDRNSVRTALQTAMTALDDWSCTYAPEFCDPKRVQEAKNRLSDQGTLYYIAATLAQCRKAMKENND